MDDPITCPAGRYVAGATDLEGGCVCKIMELDQARKDPILEGAPIGVYVSRKDDPSTFVNFCAGSGEPLANPDDMAHRDFGDGHYTGCPIWAAAVELTELDKLLKGGRIFAPEEAPPATSVQTPHGRVGGMALEPDGEDADLVHWLAGPRVG